MRVACFPFLQDLSKDGSFFILKIQKCAGFRHIGKENEWREERCFMHGIPRHGKGIREL